MGWFDEQGVRYLSPEEQAERERLAKEQEKQARVQERLEKEQEREARVRLENYLRSQGIDPDQISD